MIEEQPTSSAGVAPADDSAVPAADLSAVLEPDASAVPDAEVSAVPDAEVSAVPDSEVPAPVPPDAEPPAVAFERVPARTEPRTAPDGLIARVPSAKVALSTASTYPESTASAFEIAARLGYDGVEIMVWTDPVSQDIEALRRLSDYHGVPILAIHAPCLIITQRVWGTEPWVKLVRAQQAAERLGAETVVVHPPFRWQRDYARDFIAGIEKMGDETPIQFAVENMFPLRARGRAVVPYAPDWSPVDQDYRHVTLDTSHTAVSQSDALAMADALGDRLVHLHIADGMGSARDEHLIPGRGTQPCAELLERLAERGYDGLVVVEVNTRKAESRADREADLAEALAFTRLNMAAPAVADLRRRA